MLPLANPAPSPFPESCHLFFGEELDIGNLGFTLNIQATDNVVLRTSYSSNVFGADNVDNSLIRLQIVYAWHPIMENMKRLKMGH